MNVRFRLMTVADIAEAIHLKDAAGWNQAGADWARFLSASPDGCFIAEREGRVVGTSTTIVYEGRFASPAALRTKLNRGSGTKCW